MEREQFHEQVFERYSHYEPQVAQGLTLSLPRFGRGRERGIYSTEGEEYAKSGQDQWRSLGNQTRNGESARWP